MANKQTEIPDSLLVQSNHLKKLGEEKNIQELKKGCYFVEENFEHKIGLISCGIFNSKSYYCANYGQGTLVVTIDDNKIPSIDKDNIENILMKFDQLISIIDLNHKEAFKNYLIDRDLLLNVETNRIMGLRNSRKILAEFDDLCRLISLKCR